MFKAFILSFMVMLFGCASNSKTTKFSITEVEIIPGQTVKIDSFLNHFINKKQVIKLIDYQGHGGSRKVQVIIKPFGEDLIVSCLSLSGIELITIKLKDNSIQKIAGILDLDLHFLKRVIADILLTEVSISELNKVLPKGIVLKYSHTSREFYLNEVKQIEILYDNANIKYKHNILNYSISITNLTVAQ